MNKRHQPDPSTHNQPPSDSVQDRTHQQRDQEALRKSEEKYHRLFDAIDEAFCTIEVLFDDQGKAVDYRFLETNPAFLRQTGLHNVIGQRALDFVPNLEPFWFDTYGQVAKTGQAIRFEHQALAMDRYYDVYAFRVDEPNQNHIAVLFNDISKRKRHEANLAFLAEVSQELALLTDIDQTMNALGQKIAMYLGLSASSFAELYEGANPGTLTAVISHGWYRDDVPSHLGTYRMDEFMTPEIMQLCLAGKAVVIRDVFEDPRTNGEQYAGLRIGSFISMPLVRDGKWRFLLVIYRSETHDWSQEEIELTRELTTRLWTRLERARTEAALQASQKRFESIANLVPDLLWDSAPDGSTTWYNQRWLAYTGQLFEEAIGWGWADSIHPDDREDSAKHYSEAVEVGQSFRQEHRIRRYDGAYRWFVVSASPLKDQTGQVIKMYGAATDIHESKLAEEALRQSEEQYRQLSAHLEEQIQERTQELEISVQELKRSNDNLQQFAYVASHDLQEPLRKIQQFGDLLKTQYTELAGEGFIYLERMQSAAARMSVLIRDLLNYARMATQRDSSTAVALNEVVTGILTDLEMLIEETQARIEVEALPVVEGDAQQLGQLLQNLLNNALKFRQPGVVPRIAIKASWLAADHLPEGINPSRVAIAYHRIEVADNGIGFDEKYLDRIFQVFQRLHGKSAYTGTGIGLAICEKVVANHGGAITASSQPGQGATFIIYLPV